MNNPLSMIEQTNLRLAVAGTCDVCGCMMPAGWWVVPFGRNLAACSSACAASGIGSLASHCAAGDALREQADDLEQEAEDLRDEAMRIEDKADGLRAEAEGLDRLEAQRQAERAAGAGTERFAPLVPRRGQEHAA